MPRPLAPPSLVELASLVALALALASSACRPRPQMCVASHECAGTEGCVGGRCEPLDGGTSLGEQNDAGYLVRRIVKEPTEVAWIRRGDARGAMPMPDVFVMGRASDGEALLFTKFDVTLPEARIVGAYLLLARADTVDVDPAPIGVHALRVVEPWDGARVSWDFQPRTEELRAPSTHVSPAGPGLIRVDVRAIVERWKFHDKRDQGIALVAENVTATGISFRFLPPEGTGVAPRVAASPASPSPLGVGTGQVAAGALGTAEVSLSEPAPISSLSPRLELYLK